jgi:hypothetical protein
LKSLALLQREAADPRGGVGGLEYSQIEAFGREPAGRLLLELEPAEVAGRKSQQRVRRSSSPGWPGNTPGKILDNCGVLDYA